MLVKDIMTKEPLTADENASLKEVAAIMEKCDIGSVLITSDDHLVGIITDRDLVVKAIAMGLDINERQAKEIMSTDLYIASPNTDVNEAAEMMISRKIRRLPVLEFDKIVGIVSLGDLAVASKDSAATGHVLEEVSEPIGPKCRL